jgi:hypothetical protein
VIDFDAGSTVDLVADRSRPGRPFEPVEEAELLPHLLAAARAIVGRAKTAITVREFVGPFGVADLCAIAVNEAHLDARRMAGVVPILNDVDARIIAAASSSHSRQFDDICIRASLNSELVERRLPMLRRFGAIDITRNGRITKNPGLRPVGTVHALESKVRDWRRGLIQTTTYGLWADSSTLLLGRKPADEADLYQRVANLGCGLAIRSTLISRPQSRRHAPWRRFWAAEHVVAAIGTY